MPSWIQDPETGKFIPKEQYLREKQSREFYIRDDIEPFISPIDQSVISSRSKLREHNLKHGVTDLRDYGDDWFKRKAKERAEQITGKADRAERIEQIKRTLYQHGVID